MQTTPDASLLTIFDRIYALQREYPLGSPLLGHLLFTNDRRLCFPFLLDDPADHLTMEGMRQMADQVDFIDGQVARCLRNGCWNVTPTSHVSADNVCDLLKRYSRPPFSSLSDAQEADVFITRHWLRNRLFVLGLHHGYIEQAKAAEEMRPTYAIIIAWQAITTCFNYGITSLEVHGIGLVSSRSAYIA